MSPDAIAIKKVTKAATEAAGGTGVLDAFGCRQQRLSDLGNLNLEESKHQIRVTEAALLDDLRMDRGALPHFARYFAARQGFALVRLPTSAPLPGDWHAAMAATSKETSDVIQRVCEAVPGGVSAVEIRRLRLKEEIREAQEQLAALDALVDQVLEGQG